MIEKAPIVSQVAENTKRASYRCGAATSAKRANAAERLYPWAESGLNPKLSLRVVQPPCLDPLKERRAGLFAVSISQIHQVIGSRSTHRSVVMSNIVDDFDLPMKSGLDLLRFAARMFVEA